MAPPPPAHISVHHPLVKLSSNDPTRCAICLLLAPDHRRSALLCHSLIPEHPHSLVKDKPRGGSFHLQPLSTASDRQFPKHIPFRMPEITPFTPQICSPTLFQGHHHSLPRGPRLSPCPHLPPGLHKPHTPAYNQLSHHLSSPRTACSFSRLRKSILYLGSGTKHTASWPPHPFYCLLLFTLLSC